MVYHFYQELPPIHMGGHFVGTNSHVEESKMWPGWGGWKLKKQKQNISDAGAIELISCLITLRINSFFQLYMEWFKKIPVYLVHLLLFIYSKTYLCN